MSLKLGVNLKSLIISCLVGTLFYFIPVESVHSQIKLDPNSFKLLGVFIGTITAIITKAMPLGQLAIFSITLVNLTQTLNMKDSLSGLASPVCWLIVMAFFISRGFSKTGLGTRIAYFFISIFGKRTLGLAYGLVVADALIAPAIPSSTARAGGVFYPIVKSLALNFGSDPKEGKESSRKIGSYLMKVAFEGNMITSALFLTAMAANPLVASFAQENGMDLGFGKWFLAMSIPGIVSLMVIPYVIYKIFPPTLKETPNAPKLAKEKLKELGPLKREEKVMLFVFFLLLGLWIVGGFVPGFDATLVAFIGLTILLLMNVLSWNDILKESSAWDTLIWFTTLLTMANFLNKFGLISYIGTLITIPLSNFSWPVSYVLLLLFFFYSHYFFASATSHISAMVPVILSVGLMVGVPPYLMILPLAAFGSVFCGLTHYGNGPAPIIFGSGYIELKDWWRTGFITSLFHFSIWIIVGGAWWKAIGLW